MCCGLIRLHGFFMVCCRLYFLSCGCLDILYSHFPVTSSRIDQFSGTYFNKLYLRNPSGYVLLWLKREGCLNSVMSFLLQNVENEQSPPWKKYPVVSHTHSSSPPFFFFLRRYNFREVLAFSTNSFHFGRFLMQSFQFVIFIFVISLFTSSSNLFSGLPSDLVNAVPTHILFLPCCCLLHHTNNNNGTKRISNFKIT